MAAVMLLVYLWGAVQQLLLGSLARTIGLRMTAIGLLTGLSASFFVAVALQYGLLALLLAGDDRYGAASWRLFLSKTASPVIEEVVKVLPLLLLARLATVRAQWSRTDFVIMGGAMGAGFGLMESLLRFSAITGASGSFDRGWIVGGVWSYSVLPSLPVALVHWVPGVGGTSDLIGHAFNDAFDWHLLWSSVAGLGVGLATVGRRRARWLWAVVLIGYVAADHAAYNSALRREATVVAILSAPLDWLRPALPLLPLAALAVAGWLDRREVWGSGLGRPERDDLARAGRAVTRGRWSPWTAPLALLLADRRARMRRASANAARRGAPAAAALLAADGQSLSARLLLLAAGLRWQPRLDLRWVRQPRSIAALVVAGLLLLYLWVGAFPTTAWLQRLLASTPGWWLMRGAALPVLLLGVTRLPALLALARRAGTLPRAASAAQARLVAWSAVAATAMAAVALAVALVGDDGPRATAFALHGADALSAAELIALVALAMLVLIAALAAAEVIAGAVAAAEVAEAAALTDLAAATQAEMLAGELEAGIAFAEQQAAAHEAALAGGRLAQTVAAEYEAAGVPLQAGRQIMPMVKDAVAGSEMSAAQRVEVLAQEMKNIRAIDPNWQATREVVTNAEGMFKGGGDLFGIAVRSDGAVYTTGNVAGSTTSKVVDTVVQYTIEWSKWLPYP